MSSIDAINAKAARAAAHGFAAELGLEPKLHAYEAHRWVVGGGAHPSLQLDDVSGIPFLVDIAGVEEYQHRGRLRAGTDDMYATVTPASPGYEAYCQEILGMGRPEHLIAEPVGPAISVARACGAGATRKRLSEAAANAGRFSIHPYMGIEDVWELAAILAADSGAEVRVLAPPPPVTWIANDKAAFDELVTRVLGSQALVETRVSRTRADVASDLRSMAEQHRRVGLKRTRCASAMGNAVFRAEDVSEPHLAERCVDAFLDRTQWPEGEEILTVAWLETDLSPSTQLWIPPRGLGEPRLDGVYEQILSGEERMFVGSRPSSLPAEVNAKLARDSLLVCIALQELGYVGRCSFDFLVSGNPWGEFAHVFTECNGRWGGTSAPMSLLDRLIPGPRPAYRAQDVVFPELIGARFTDLLAMVGADLFEASTGQGRFIFYNLGPLEAHGKFDVISIGQTLEDAEIGVLERLPSLLRVSG